ncbi:MAG: 4Fe-4S binding protein [Clostridiaceae bacterium]|nr:4Fe-4S binding protein [Clostridiaceae bacterium]
MSEKKLSRKQIKKIHTLLRAAIQFYFFIMLPSAYNAAFAGVKYLFTQLGAGEMIAVTSFVSVLLVLSVYTIFFGRFFCGFACAFGALGDAVHALYVWACRKWKKKPVDSRIFHLKAVGYLRYLILIVILAACFGGIYAKAAGWSPWDVFLLLRAGNFALGGYAAGCVLLVFSMIGMAVCERFFCRFFCPMGAIFSLLPVLPAFSLHRQQGNCVNGCSGCQNACALDLELPDLTTDGTNDCIMCQKCMDACPKSNICNGLALRNEVWFTLLRAVILAALLHVVGV